MDGSPSIVANAQSVLHGVRVLDCGRFIAGPYCACLLGDLGADVVRVERVGGGEDRYLAPLAADGSGATFLHVNRNKRGLTLDPMAPAGRDVLHRLVAGSDVVVANLPGAALGAMGLDYETVRSVRRDVILTTVDTFGPGGPRSEWVGFDGIAQVMSGAAYLGGDHGAPRKAAVPWADFSTAAFAAFGTLAALLWRRETGQGQHVQGALLMSALTMMGGALAEQGVLEPDHPPVGNRSHHAAPYDIFATRDGWLMVQIVGTPLFRRLAHLLGDRPLAGDPRFATDAGRAEHADELNTIVATWCAARSTDDALAALAAARIPAGSVATPREVLADAHVTAAGLLQPVDYPGLPRPAPIAGPPLRLSATPPRIARRAPHAGEHTDEVLAEHGFTTDEIASLRERAVV